MSTSDLLITALNMLIVSLHHVLWTKSRLVLKQEYNNVIDKIRIEKISSEPQLMELYHKVKNATKKELLEEETFGQKGFLATAADIAIDSFDMSDISLSKFAGNFIFGSLKEASKLLQSKEEQLKIKPEKLHEYDALKDELLHLSGKLLQQYNFSENYILDHECLDRFCVAIEESDLSKRLRILSRIEDKFSLYYPYWVYRAKAAQSSQNNKEAFNCFSKFAKSWCQILQVDTYKIEAMKYWIGELISRGLTQENVKMILKYLADMKKNANLINDIYVGMVYLKLGYQEQAIESLLDNVDYHHENFMSAYVFEKIKDSQKNPEIASNFASYFFNKLREGKTVELTILSWMEQTGEINKTAEAEHEFVTTALPKQSIVASAGGAIGKIGKYIKKTSNTQKISATVSTGVQRFSSLAKGVFSVPTEKQAEIEHDVEQPQVQVRELTAEEISIQSIYMAYFGRRPDAIITLKETGYINKQGTVDVNGLFELFKKHSDLLTMPETPDIPHTNAEDGKIKDIYIFTAYFRKSENDMITLKEADFMDENGFINEDDLFMLFKSLGELKFNRKKLR